MNNDNKIAPIALFVYNRPWHTRQTIESLRDNELAERSDLIIFSDGPKTAADDDSVASVRNYLKSIQGFRTVTVIERINNWGLAANIIDGVTETVNKFGRVIVLEDDLLTNQGFLDYMNQALTRYKDEDQVMQISGHMFAVDIVPKTDAVFLPLTTSWGWATWKRSWDHFDPSATGYEKLKNDRTLRYKFNLDGSYNYFNMLLAQKNNKVDSWAIRWYLSVFMMNGLTLFPISSFIENIGFDGSGTHCGNVMPKHDLLRPTSAAKKNISFPEVSPDLIVYRQLVDSFMTQRFSFCKLKSLLYKFISRNFIKSRKSRKLFF